ncbi:MAG: MFS transporter, partial [Coriobacteriaceae bacterium]|nr:MFS transporter [Coriobacteriaceae bacterium]
MPLLVPDRHLVRITSLDQGLAGITNIVAPALGIFFYTAFGLQIALFADAFGALVACGLLALISIPDVHMARADRTGILNEIVDGVNEVREHRGLGLLFVFMALGIIAFMPMASLFPLMTYSHFGGDGYDAALVEAVWGIGFVVGSIVLGIWGGGKRLLLLIMVSILIQGVLTFILGLMPRDSFVLFVALCLPLAIAGAFFNGPINAIIARKIKPEKLGRVMALMGTVMSLSAPIGLMIAGPIAEYTGVPFWFLASGVGLVAIPIIAMLFPSIRALDREEAVFGQEEA